MVRNPQWRDNKYALSSAHGVYLDVVTILGGRLVAIYEFLCAVEDAFTHDTAPDSDRSTETD